MMIVFDSISSKKLNGHQVFESMMIVFDSISSKKLNGHQVFESMSLLGALIFLSKQHIIIWQLIRTGFLAI